MPLLSWRCTALQHTPCRLSHQCSTACRSPIQRRTSHTRSDLPHLGTGRPRTAHTLHLRSCCTALPHMLCSSRPLYHSTYPSSSLRHILGRQCVLHCPGIGPPRTMHTPPSPMHCSAQPRTPCTCWHHCSPVCSSSIRLRTPGIPPWTQSCIDLPRTPCMMHRQPEQGYLSRILPNMPRTASSTDCCTAPPRTTNTRWLQHR